VIALATAMTVLASWFGPGLYGNTMACGATLTPATTGVAHKSLPCGRLVTVCARRCARLRVVDRGPFVGGRTFDLTPGAVHALGGSTRTWGVRPVRWVR
jgi:rare lipoprotein A